MLVLSPFVQCQFQDKRKKMDFLLLLLFAAFSEGMVDDGGYTDVVNIDISSVVIEAMQNKYRDRPQLKCILNYDELMSYRYHDFHI